MSTIDSTKPGAFISLTKAAEMLSISVPTLRRRLAAGELPAFRSGRRIIRIRVSDLDKLLRRVPSAHGWSRGHCPSQARSPPRPSYCCPTDSGTTRLSEVRSG
jgi:excisionase family DNA binding protein